GQRHRGERSRRERAAGADRRRRARAAEPPGRNPDLNYFRLTLEKAAIGRLFFFRMAKLSGRNLGAQLAGSRRLLLNLSEFRSILANATQGGALLGGNHE